MNMHAPGIKATWLPSKKAKKGKPLDLHDRVISFEFEDSQSASSKATLSLDNSDLSLFDRKDLFSGSLIEFSWGYKDNLYPPQRFVIHKIKGFRKLTIEGHCVSILMDKVPKTRAWHNNTRSEVVKQIAKENGFEGKYVHIDDTQTSIETINQAAQTDARFLKRLARKVGFVFFVDETGFHFHKRKDKDKPKVVLDYLEDYENINIQIDSDLRFVIGEVTLKSFNPKTKKVDEGTAKQETDKKEGEKSGNPEDLKALIDKVESELGMDLTVAKYVTNAQGEDVIELREDAKVTNQKAQTPALRVKISCPGRPEYRAKQTIELRNVHPRIDGRYYVMSVKHSIGLQKGYRCELSLRKNGHAIEAK